VNISTPAVTTVNVNIQGMAFSPSSLSITVNTTVVWTNLDGMTHTVTGPPGRQVLIPAILGQAGLSRILSPRPGTTPICVRSTRR
jgi:plastocyanin